MFTWLQNNHRRILHIHWMDFVSNDVVRSRTGQPLLLETIRRRRLSFFGHLCCADANQDHSRALQACIRGPPKDWQRRTGRPRQTWLRTVEDDLRPLNFGLASARRHAWDRPAWHTLVEAATSSWHAPEREREHISLGYSTCTSIRSWLFPLLERANITVPYINRTALSEYFKTLIQSVRFRPIASFSGAY